jgi:hypothetical protein
MTHITVVNGPTSGTQVALARGETCTIGSGPDCTIRIELAGIAAVQAEIKALKQEGFGIKRAGGPVAINGASVEAARLTDGDVIDIGSVQLLYGPPAASNGVRGTGAAGAAAVAETARLEKGRMLGGFKLKEVLGKGGMGTVYRAEQVSLHREVALKVLDHKLTQDPVFVARFVAEARAAARLHHPNVVQVYDVGHEGSTYYYSMELMTEGSVETKLKGEGQLEAEGACKAIADAARGLAYAESLRIVHRDIKPDNLMLDHHGSVKLADLGLAMTDDESESKVVGTPHFMSPEQILRKPLDHRSDLYSLGCTFYRLLTGKNPFSGASVKDILRAQVKDAAEPTHRVNSAVPAEVSAIVQRLMAKEPGERFQSANELVEALEQVLRPPVRKGMLIGGIVAAVLVAGGAIAYAVTRPEGETKVVTETIVNPEDAANRQRAREAEAKAAYLECSRDRSGLPLAEALEAMAKAHEGTEHAGIALTEARKVREDVARAEAAAADRASQLAQWENTLRTRVRAALAKSDLHGAVAGLARGDVPEALRDDPLLHKASDDLAAEVQAQAKTRLQVLRDAVDAARSKEDASALEQAAQELTGVLEGDGAWPKLALPDAQDGLAKLATARQDVQRLRAAERRGRVESAWSQLHAAFTDGSGVLAAVQRLQWSDALQAADKVAGELGDAPPAEHARALADSLRRALAHLGRLKEAAQAGTLTLPVPGEPEPSPVTAFVPEGEQAAFTVKVGPKHQPRPQVVKFQSLSPDILERVLALPESEPADVACVLGWLELAHVLEAARSYLMALDANSDASGTGAGGFARSDQGALRVQEALAEQTSPWAKALANELFAAGVLAQALQAFSGHRNLAAAELAERVLKEHARSLVTAALK